MARFLSDEYDYARVSFADPLRQMEGVFYSMIGAESVLGRGKEDLIHNDAGVENVSSRRVLQTLGTEWGRNCIDPLVWVKIAMKAVKECEGRGVDVVIDDVRFLNEYTAIKQAGGELWYIHRPDVNYVTTHPSEGELNGYLFDRAIVNDSTVTQLLARAEHALWGARVSAGPTREEARARHGDIYAPPY